MIAIINTECISVGSTGKTVLGDDFLVEIGADFIAGGSEAEPSPTNENCDGTSNSGCTNGGCGQTSNTGCSNGLCPGSINRPSRRITN